MKTITIATRFAANLEYTSLNELNTIDKADFNAFCADLSDINPRWKWSMDECPIVARCAISRANTECYVIHIN